MQNNRDKSYRRVLVAHADGLGDDLRKATQHAAAIHRSPSRTGQAPLLRLAARLDLYLTRRCISGFCPRRRHHARPAAQPLPRTLVAAPVHLDRQRPTPATPPPPASRPSPSPPASPLPTPRTSAPKTLDGGALIPADLAADTRARAVAIARAAHRLTTLRDAWLNPPEWTERVPEVVPLGMAQSPYPHRIVARLGFEK
jgi:hypothetical protein